MNEIDISALGDIPICNKCAQRVKIGEAIIQTITGEVCLATPDVASEDTDGELGVTIVIHEVQHVTCERIQ